MHGLYSVVVGLGLGMTSVLFASAGSGALAEGLSLAPTNMPRIGIVDERYQSYNVEMLEVTGGRFWKLYKDIRRYPRHPPTEPQPRHSAGTFQRE